MGIVSAVYSQTEILQKEVRRLQAGTRLCAMLGRVTCSTRPAAADVAALSQVFLVERLDAAAGEAMLHIKVRAA